VPVKLITLVAGPLLGAFLNALSFAGTAEAVTFNISWTGSGGYSLTGQLTFASGLLGTGVINESQIQNLTINVLLNGVSQGTASLASFTAPQFNLNFDTTTDQFVVGDVSGGSAGQIWNFDSATSVGFASGSEQQIVSVNGSEFGNIVVGDSTLTATLTSETPLPAALPLFATGVGAIGLLARRKKRKAVAA
jgi:hypothetical protein